MNNAAFHDHAEQGGWDQAALTRRLDEPWFDADGFLLHERDGRLAGFCWTKLHPAVGSEPEMGEIYVIAVHPDFHGLGLGRALTVAGLQSISERGVRTGMLHVDGDNVAGMGLYRSLGFQVHHTSQGLHRRRRARTAPLGRHRRASVARLAVVRHRDGGDGQRRGAPRG